MSEQRWTIWVCDKGHVEAGSLHGVCWRCYPGGRRTWEIGNPRQTEPNQTRIEVAPASSLSTLYSAIERKIEEWEKRANRNEHRRGIGAEIAARVQRELTTELAALLPDQPDQPPVDGADGG